jgi:hypothetical protein
MEECKHQHKDFMTINGSKYEFCAYCGEVLDKVEELKEKRTSIDIKFELVSIDVNAS